MLNQKAFITCHVKISQIEMYEEISRANITLLQALDEHVTGGDKVWQFFQSLVEDCRHPAHKTKKWMIAACMNRPEFDLTNRFMRLNSVLQTRW